MLRKKEPQAHLTRTCNAFLCSILYSNPRRYVLGYACIIHSTIQLPRRGNNYFIWHTTQKTWSSCTPQWYKYLNRLEIDFSARMKRQSEWLLLNTGLLFIRWVKTNDYWTAPSVERVRPGLVVRMPGIEGSSLRWLPISSLAWSLYKCAALWRSAHGTSATEKNPWVYLYIG